RTSSGLILIDKPVGLTSQQAVQRVRRALGVERAGHTGTLDPFATGLLLVLLGRATRLAAYVVDEPKEYEATVRFGVETDTDDSTGTATRVASAPSEGSIARGVALLTGAIEQTPPAFSAKHVAGRRAYALARRGASLQLAPVQVRVERWTILAQTADTLRVRITCSGGTYIRALARDLGRLTGSAAHCAELRRTRCGPFAVSDAVTPDAAQPGDVLPPAIAVRDLPTQAVDAAGALGVAHGRPIAATIDGARSALVDAEGNLVAIAERADNHWHPRVVLSEPAVP
ncbi:MAG: tRNA pseudouridine(55) synthase TruB, partial [Gemmatimonadota bacterium]